MLASIVIAGSISTSLFAQESGNAEFSENNQVDSFIESSAEAGSAETGTVTFINDKGTKFEAKVYEMSKNNISKKGNEEYQVTYVASSNLSCCQLV